MKPEAIHRVIRLLKEEVRRWPQGAVGNFMETPFTVLISTVLSLRTQDKTTNAASDRLFRLAKTPRAMLKLSDAAVQKAIYPVCFYRVKTKTIRKICLRLVESHGGEVPNDLDRLLELPGVGRKTANLVLTLGFRKPGICVDTHVHRITNRWGYVRARTPDETEQALRRKLPAKYWMILNDLLVPYGQNLCRPISPHCSRCRLKPHCAARGVKARR